MDARVEAPASPLDVAMARVQQGLASLSVMRFDEATLLAIRLICYAGLLLANFYGWTMTATGFVNTQFLPDNSVLSNWYIPRVVAAFVQLGILAWYLTVPYFSKRYIINGLASIFAISLITLSALFALFSITLTSQSQNIVGQKFNTVRGMNKTIVQLDDLITNTFTTQVSGLDELYNRACHGLDQTGIHQCGSIALHYLQEANTTRARYGAQLGVRGKFSEIASASSILDASTTVRGNYDILAQKLDAYAAFTRDAQLSSSAVKARAQELRRDLDAFSLSLGERDPDKKTLVLTRVFEDLGRLFRGKGDSLIYFSLAIALLPDALSLTFTMLLMIVRGASQESIGLRTAVRKAQEEAELYGNLADATQTLHKAKQGWRNARRNANVAEAVDESVPDTAAE